MKNLTNHRKNQNSAGLSMHTYTTVFGHPGDFWTGWYSESVELSDLYALNICNNYDFVDSVYDLIENGNH